MLQLAVKTFLRYQLYFKLPIKLLPASILCDYQNYFYITLLPIQLFVIYIIYQSSQEMFNENINNIE